MTMTRKLFGGITLLALALFLTTSTGAQENKGDKPHDHDHAHDHGDQKTAGQKQGDEVDPQMAAWLKHAAPGEHHQHLQPMVGRWDLTVKWRMGLDAPWEETRAVSEVRWVLGGRYLQENVLGDEYQGMRFEGLGVTGYDNHRQKYTSMWADNMSTSPMLSTGTCDNSGKVITFTGVNLDPMTGKEKKTRFVWRFINENKQVNEEYTYTPDGKEFKSMEIVYTRK